MDNTKHNKKIRETINAIIDVCKVQIIITILGLASVLIGILYPNLTTIVRDILTIIGGALFSSGIVSFSFEWLKYKSDNDLNLKLNELQETISSNKDQYLLTTDYMSFKATFDNTTFFQEHISKKVKPIMKREDMEVSVFKFLTLTKAITKEKIEKNNKGNSKTKHNPDEYLVIIYGTTLGFLIDKNDIEENKKAIIEAVKTGINFKMSLFDPCEYSWDTHQHRKLKEKTKKSVGFIRDITGILSQKLKSNEISASQIGSFDLRISTSITQNSFSSFSFEDRGIRVFDYNIDIDPENPIKYSQIFDEKGDTYLCENSLSFGLHKLYKCWHKRSVPAIIFPQNKLTIYVIGLKRSDTSSKIVFVYNDVNSKEKCHNISMPHLVLENNTNELIYEAVSNSFKEQTGYKIQLIEQIPTKRSDVLFIRGNITQIKPQKDASKKIIEYYYTEVEDLDVWNNIEYVERIIIADMSTKTSKQNHKKN